MRTQERIAQLAKLTITGCAGLALVAAGAASTTVHAQQTTGTATQQTQPAPQGTAGQNTTATPGTTGTAGTQQPAAGTQQPATGTQPAAGTQPAGGQPAAQAAAQNNARVFASDAGLVLNFIKPDHTADFEEIVNRLKEALNKSDKPERKQQAASWKVFRAVEPGPNGSVLYVFDIDPAVHGADYTVSTILAEGFPPELVQELYKKYADAYASGQNVVNLKLVASLAP
jgi:hypothetical protein